MPFVTDGSREYRSFTTAFSPAGGEDGGSAYRVRGYATTFDDPYDMGFGAYETVSPHALDAADMSDVIFQFDHKGLVMARQRNGSLRLSCDEHGLLVEADLGGTREGRDLYEAIANGLVDRMSWGFSVDEDGWEYNRETHTSTITRVRKVYDVSAVSIPANDNTAIHARSYLDGVIEAERRESALRDKEERERVAASLALRSL